MIYSLTFSSRRFACQNPMNNQETQLPDDVVLSVRHVSKKFCRNLKRSMLYGMRDLARNMFGGRPGGGGGEGRGLVSLEIRD